MIKSLGTGDPYVQSYFVELWSLSGFAQLSLGLNKQHKPEYKRQAVYKFHENEAFLSTSIIINFIPQNLCISKFGLACNKNTTYNPIKFSYLVSQKDTSWAIYYIYNLLPNKVFIPSCTKRHLSSNLLDIQPTTQ